MFGNFFIKVNRIFAGRSAFQGFYQFLHTISLQGMNVGMGSLVESSGEQYVITYIKNAHGVDLSLIIFDVGANIGDFSSEVQNIIGPSAILYCFEPKKSTFDSLRRRFPDNEKLNLLILDLEIRMRK